MTDTPDYEVVARGGAAYAGVIREIANERVRQVEQEGWTPEHDDTHNGGEMALAAACYAANLFDLGYPGEYQGASFIVSIWPWSDEWWKPGDRRRDLVKAGALIVAEIERLDRAAAKGG